ncbi:hypothetical protein OF83DRAFT_1043275, partial [Amylostereum chailletii]
ETVGSKHFSVRIPGPCVHELAPSVTVSSAGAKNDLSWLISTSQLDNACKLAWELMGPQTDTIIGNIELLPRTDTQQLPYQDARHEFWVIKDLPPHLRVHNLKPDDVVDCKLCGELKKIRNMRDHVGRHLLCNLYGAPQPIRLLPGKLIGFNPCGWCGEDGCTIQLTKTPQGSSKITSSCPYHYAGMIYSRAATPSATTPCTNIPIHCGLCSATLSGQPRTIWKYNAVYHVLSKHVITEEPKTRPSMPPSMLHDIHISSEEAQLIGVPQEAIDDYRMEYDLP